MQIAVLRESFPGERRVAIVPAVVPSLVKLGLDILVEAGAGAAAGFPDGAYEKAGAKIVLNRGDAAAADCLLQVRTLGANPVNGQSDLPLLRSGQVVIGLCDPLSNPQAASQLAERGVTVFALELMPRISRAQSMDVLSSMATVAGYRAVLLAATTLPKMFPLLTTAAGTLTPAKVFVIGAGVAGLQAIATARRLGAVVSAYDVRSAVKEQIQSLGAKFVEMPLEAGAAEVEGGYAKQMDEDFYRQQRELLARVVSESDVVVATAAIPGKQAPLLITAEAVRGMRPGSVIVDLAAERGGNCELTKPGETIETQGVTIIGRANLPSEVPNHASQMFAKNVATFLAHFIKAGQFHFDTTDQITRDTMIARGGNVVHPAVQKLLSQEERERGRGGEGEKE
ncbi:MAG: Re/Si-specific NAD(P)(+) transhydrogenase subunit alpha [Pirellulales bacterium]